MASAAAVKATCLSGLAHSRSKASPALLSAPRNTSRRSHRSMAPVRAMGVTPWILGVAEVATKPGDVDAPIGLIVGGAILVTIVLTAGIPALLSPGNKAAEKIFERDARSGRKR